MKAESSSEKSDSSLDLGNCKILEKKKSFQKKISHIFNNDLKNSIDSLLKSIKIENEVKSKLNNSNFNIKNFDEIMNFNFYYPHNNAQNVIKEIEKKKFLKKIKSKEKFNRIPFYEIIKNILSKNNKNAKNIIQKVIPVRKKRRKTAIK